LQDYLFWQAMREETKELGEKTTRIDHKILKQQHQQLFPKFIPMSVSARDGSTTLHSQVEHLQMKYVGTGHADTNKLYVVCYLTNISLSINVFVFLKF
jgi:hypothetical protein